MYDIFAITQNKIVNKSFKIIENSITFAPAFWAHHIQNIFKLLKVHLKNEFRQI